MISCTDAVRQLWEYLEGAVPDEQRASIENHLSLCLRCCGAAEFADELRRFLEASAEDDMPDEVRARLTKTLEELTP